MDCRLTVFAFSRQLVEFFVSHVKDIKFWYNRQK